MELISPAYLQKEKLITKGAEAEIFEGRYLGKKVIIKSRIQKKYREKSIDNKLRKERSVQEIRIIQVALTNKLPVPRIYNVIKGDWSIIMEKFEGIALKKKIDSLDHKSFKHLGEIVGKLHQLDIIHGDLTTSNILIENNNFKLIDFGLGYISTEIEDKAVDVLVFKHILDSSHAKNAESIFKNFLIGYSTYKSHETIIQRTKQIENRVRYRSHSVI